MKITITYEVDSLVKAHEIIAAVENATRQPYRQHGYGAAQLPEAEPQLSINEAESIEMNGGPSLGGKGERTNINPGFTACSRIGADTKAALLKALPGSDPDHIRKKIKRSLDDTQAFLQLLWERDVIKFDGEEYYL